MNEDCTQNQASTLLNSWLSLAMSSDGSRLLGSYGDQQSWSLMYNLYADKMLGLNFVPQSVSSEFTRSPRSIPYRLRIDLGYRHAHAVSEELVGDSFQMGLAYRQYNWWVG